MSKSIRLLIFNLRPDFFRGPVPGYLCVCIDFSRADQ